MVETGKFDSVTSCVFVVNDVKVRPCPLCPLGQCHYSAYILVLVDRRGFTHTKGTVERLAVLPID